MVEEKSTQAEQCRGERPGEREEALGMLSVEDD